MQEDAGKDSATPSGPEAPQPTTDAGPDAETDSDPTPELAAVSANCGGPPPDSCNIDGRILPHGETIARTPCDECLCIDGGLLCSPESCLVTTRLDAPDPNGWGCLLGGVAMERRSTATEAPRAATTPSPPSFAMALYSAQDATTPITFARTRRGPMARHRSPQSTRTARSSRSRCRRTVQSPRSWGAVKKSPPGAARVARRFVAAMDKPIAPPVARTWQGSPSPIPWPAMVTCTGA